MDTARVAAAMCSSAVVVAWVRLKSGPLRINSCERGSRGDTDCNSPRPNLLPRTIFDIRNRTLDTNGYDRLSYSAVAHPLLTNIKARVATENHGGGGNHSARPCLAA